MRVEEGFLQTPPAQPNPYTHDTVLQSLLKRLLPKNVYSTVDQELRRFGDRIITEIREMSATIAEPTITQYDHWGKRVDILNTSEGWRRLKAVSQSEGLVGIYYEREFGEFSRVYGFAKTVLMVGDGQVIFCPISMTDGCARVLELHGTPEMKRDILPKLISRDPSVAITSGQWMTERPGGSDVSRTETTAAPKSSSNSSHGSSFSLDGFKWFSSATDSDVAVALARTGDPSAGSRSLSLFLVPLRVPLLRGPNEPEPSSTSNGILVHRLKDKLGTRYVPTAELSLNNTEAYLLSSLGGGVKAITPVLNITRIHSAIGQVGGLRKCLFLAREYAQVRAVQGGRNLLQDIPLHNSELAKVSVLYHALTHLVFGAVHLLGKTECNVASPEEERRLRLLTPTVKAFAADRSVTAMEECMSALGGQGYMEETGIASCIRDGLVEKIWEGTVNVLALDLIRAAKDRSVVEAFASWAQGIIESCPTKLQAQVSSAVSTLRSAVELVQKALLPPVNALPLTPRPTVLLFGHVCSAIYLLEHAIWAHKMNEDTREVDVEVFRRWVEEMGMDSTVRDLERAIVAGPDRVEADKAIVYSKSPGLAKL